MAVFTAALVFWVAVARGLQMLTNDEEPLLFYEQLEPEEAEQYAGLLTIAHNSGNSRPATQSAIAYHADAIEIDVLEVGGQLRAAHTAPTTIVGEYLSQSPSLASAWANAQPAGTIVLDLKETSPSFRDRLFKFLRSREESGVEVIITTRSVPVLEAAYERYPAALRVLSVASQAGLDAAFESPGLGEVIQGVSVRADLLTEENVAALRGREVMVIAWVVNQLPSVRELVEWGVDGVTTDNLALLELVHDARIALDEADAEADQAGEAIAEVVS